MNEDLASILSLRRVLDSVSLGEGVSRSAIEELRDGPKRLKETSKTLLLGHPLVVALAPLTDSGSDEVSILASLLLSAPRSSTSLVGENGRSMAATLERWVKLKEGSKMERRVLRFRSILTSGVLGAVTAMVSTLGPLVGNLGFVGQSAGGAGYLAYAAAAMTALSSAMLGYFLSGRGFMANVAVALGTFLVVSSLASPLAGFNGATTWGVK